MDDLSDSDGQDDIMILHSLQHGEAARSRIDDPHDPVTENTIQVWTRATARNEQVIRITSEWDEEEEWWQRPGEIAYEVYNDDPGETDDQALQPLHISADAVVKINDQGLCNACRMSTSSFMYSYWKRSTSLGQFKRRKFQGCGSCAMFHDAITFLKGHLPAPATDASMFSIVPKELHESDRKTHYPLKISLQNSLETFSVEFFSTSPPEAPRLRPVVPTLPRVPIDPLSDACCNTIRSWIDQCANEHPECQTPLSSYLPRRVIDIGPSDGSRNPFLYESKTEEAAPYAALSYCWGSSVALKTTRETLTQKLQDIPWDDIPGTLQDALRLTRQLGLRYIWIDSLCIIQDDRLDWEEQASQMASIYEGSYVTITPAQAPDSNTRFLFDRKADQEFHYRTPTNESFSTFFRLSLDHSWIEQETSASHLLSQDGPIKYPLFTRAWCFQEQVLSSRVLLVTNEEYVFQCRTHSKCECGYMQRISKKTEPLVVRRAYLDFLNPSATSLQTQPGNPSWASKQWQELVEGYSLKSLTFPRDKLSALSGIASRIPQDRMGSYVAGLWEKELIYGLLWVRYQEGKSDRYIPPIAPSFSWVSINAPVHWEFWSSYKCRFQVRILEISCPPGGLDAFGQVDDGFLRVKSLVMNAQLGPCAEKHLLSPERDILWNGESESFMCDVNGDETLVEGTVLYCLHLIWSWDSKERLRARRTSYWDETNKPPGAVMAMVIRPSPDHEGAFERVGIAFGLPPWWFLGADEREMVIR